MQAPTVQEMMTPTPALCVESDPVERAARLMMQHDCGAVPVVDHPRTGRPVGVVTDRDIVTRIVARGLSTADHLVADVMTRHPVELHLGASFHDCVHAMQSRHVRRLVVVDDRGKVVGMVTDGDLARATRNHPELEHEITAMLGEVSGPEHPRPRLIGFGPHG